MNSESNELEKFQWYRICIVTPESEGKWDPDLTCDIIPAVKVNVKLPDPGSQLMSEALGMELMPYFEAKRDAGISLLD